MNYETIKSFILFVLVGVSFLLSFILWSYQPNYESTYPDTSYVNEVDVGGKEKTKNELVEPNNMIFKKGDTLQGFINPLERQKLYKEMTSWVMYDHHITKANGKPKGQQYVELTFPTAIPAELMMNLFTFDQEVNTPNWSFERIYFMLNDESKSIEVRILSMDGQRQLISTIDKTETYYELQGYFANNNNLLQENISIGGEENAIYIPKEKVNLAKKTAIASKLDTQSFINALFRNPSLVTQNFGEAYFTDGQRGLRIFQDGIRMEYINPIQANYDRLTAFELIEKGVDKINEHKGWTNNYMFDSINRSKNNIRFRLSYDGFPVYDHQQISIIEQEWRDQELYEYHRPLIRVDNLLNSDQVTLPSGESVKQRILANQRQFKMDEITDIQIGYFLTYNNEAHSLTFEPSWFIVYKNDWVRFNVEDFSQEEFERGED